MLATLQVLLFIAGGGRLGHTQSIDYQELIPTLSYYDNKYECDVREGGYLRDNLYIAKCDGFYLVLDTKELKRYRIREHNI